MFAAWVTFFVFEMVYKSPLISGTSRHVATFPFPLQRRLVIQIDFIFGSLVGAIETLHHRWPWMTLTYFCDIDMHLKDNQDLEAFYFRYNPCPRTSAVAFRSKANLSIVSYSGSAMGVPSYGDSFYVPFSRYRRANVAPNFRSSAQLSSLYFGCLYSAVSLDTDFVFGSLAGIMEALNPNNFGWPSLVTLTHT